MYHRTISLLLFLAWTLMATGLQAQNRTAYTSKSALPDQPAAPSPAQQAYDWLCKHQSAATGLLGNQESDPFSGIYPNALAAICFIHEGDIERAEKIFAAFDKHREAAFSQKPGGFHQFWNADTGEPFADTDRWLGDNAWLLIALNYYQAETGKTDFDPLRQTVTDWILSLQDQDGGIWSGYNKNGFMRSKSTEGNLDAHAALVHHPDARRKVKRFLEAKVWLPAEGRFMQGTTSTAPALDTAAWAAGSLGAPYAVAFAYVERTCLRKVASKANGRQVRGFADFPDKKRVWLEGTGEMVVAYNTAGQKWKARRYLHELEKAMIESKKFPGTAGIPCHTNDPAWADGAEKIFVPSQAWYLFGTWGFNPMNPQEDQANLHTVRQGETLSSIAESVYGDDSAWKQIHEANFGVLPDPNRIQPGQILMIP